jgi:hypothetical protein
MLRCGHPSARMLSLLRSLPSMKCLLRCLFSVAGPFPRCTQPLPMSLRATAPCPHPPHPSRKGRQGRPAPAPGEAYACTCACAPIHIVPVAGRGGLRHRSSPQGRSWPTATLCFQVFQTFSDMLQAYICFKCFSYFICMFQVFHMDVAKVD